MTILGLVVPEGQRLWFWNAGGETGTLLLAVDFDEAYRKAMASRIGDDTDPDNVENNQRWFAKNDTLEEVTSEYTGPAFVGDLPDFDY